MRLRWIAALLAVAVVATYAPVRDHGFLDYDDALYVSENAAVLDGLSVEGLRYAFRSVEVGMWHPLTWLSHMLDVQLFGLDAGAHHSVSVALHAVNAALLLWWLAALGANPWVAAFGALLFALHPLRVESVAWVAERKDLVSGLFFLLTLHAYRRYCAGRSVWRWAVVASCFALGLLAKPMVVTLPCVLLLLDLWPHRRIAWPTREDRSEWRRSAWPLLREKLPLFAMSAAASLVSLDTQAGAGAMASFDRLGLGARVANGFVAYAAYLGNVLWPADLSVFVPYPSVGYSGGEIAGSALLFVGLTSAALALGRRAPALAVGWLWWVGMLVPVIGLVQVGSQAYADRYTYLPMIGLVVAACFGVPSLFTRWAGAGVPAGARPGGSMQAARRAALPVLALGAALVLGWQTRVALRPWIDDETLFRHVLSVTEPSAYALVNVAKELDEAPNEQLALLKQALALAPRMPIANYNMGRYLAREGQLDAAIAHYRISLEGDERVAKTHNNLGNALARSRRYDDAIGHYRRALELEPGRYKSRINLASSLAARASEALAAGRAGDAERDLREAVAQAPEHAGANNDLAWLLATCPARREQASEALVYAERAVAAAPADAAALDTLAAAHAAAGDFARARIRAEGALAAASAAGDVRLAQNVAERLAAYTQGRVYRSASCESATSQSVAPPAADRAAAEAVQ